MDINKHQDLLTINWNLIFSIITVLVLILILKHFFFEKVKKFRLIRRSFSIESGELTSTLKLKRAVIQQNYAALIEDMYAE